MAWTDRAREAALAARRLHKKASPVHQQLVNKALLSWQGAPGPGALLGFGTLDTYGEKITRRNAPAAALLYELRVNSRNNPVTKAGG